MDLLKRNGAAVVVLVSTPALADSIHVDPCGDDAWSGISATCAAPDGPKATIQAALDAAEPGDQIVVAAGFYNESIDFLGKAVSVTSAAGASSTTISAAGLDTTVVRFVSGETADSILDGFLLTGGVGELLFGDERFGGGVYIEASSPTIRHCTFLGNAAGFGGGLAGVSASPTIESCVFFGNSAQLLGGGLYLQQESDATVVGCLFTGNDAGSGGGMCVDLFSVPAVSYCNFVGNTAVTGGGMFVRFESDAVISNCRFAGNEATDSGGGMTTFNASPTMSSCTFSGNSADETGGGVHFDLAAPSMVNCTLYGNTAGTEAGALFAGDFTTTPLVRNCIIWGNSLPLTGGLGTPSYQYSNVQGGIPAGPGNMSSDPLFADPDGADEELGTFDDDLSLTAGSPSIDAGDSSGIDACATDLGGRQRSVDDPASDDRGGGPSPVTDMGAIEFLGGSSDCDRNLVVDACQIEMGEFSDCNGNDMPDECELAADPSLDMNGSGVIDACEAVGDVNGDGAVDVFDLIIVITSWGACGSPCSGDTDLDGTVGVFDLIDVIVNWG